MEIQEKGTGIVQLPIYYNSWSEAFITPVGSVRIGEKVRFKLHTELPEVVRAALMIQKDGEPFRELEMTRLVGTSDFSLDFQTEGASSLYFYHFKIEYKNPDGGRQTVFYAKADDNYEGRGQVVADPGAVQQYQLTCYGSRDPAPDWYTHGVAYQIFVDRFNNGNRHKRILHPKKNSFLYACDSDTPFYIRDHDGNIARWDFYGGNLEGIIAKLPYLQKLGVTILYLSPIFEARSNHKYDTANYYKIDPMLGDEKTFRKLVVRARRRGIHIILDGVFNHVGADSIYFNQDGTYGDGGAAQDPDSPYYQWFTFQHYPDRYTCWWGVRDLPAVDNDNPSFNDYIHRAPDSVVRTWTQTGIGGWRLDVADELPDAFIAGIRKAMDEQSAGRDGCVLIGEVWEDASNKTAYGVRHHYLEGGMLHGVMNYPFRKLIIHFLLRKMTAVEMVRASFTLKANYPPEAFHASLNNIGTHDTARILTVFDGEIAKLRLAVVLLMTLPGVPCIYYGDEAGLTGGKDPDNRRFFPWGRENSEIDSIFRRAVQLRRTDRNLQDGDFFPFSIGELFGFFRIRSHQAVTLVLINASDRTQSVRIDALEDPTDDGWMAGLVAELVEDGTLVGATDCLIRAKNGRDAVVR